MYHYKHPSKYDWSQIFGVPSVNSAFNDFVCDIDNICRSEYAGESLDNTRRVEVAFSKFGYIASHVGVPDFIKLRDEVSSYHPVYISGKNNSDDIHLWLCEGYKNVKYDGVISMIIDKRWGIPDEPGSLYFDYDVKVYPPASVSENAYGEFYYMNMGYGGTNDGWYRSNTYIPNSNRNFQKDQKMWFVRKP